MGIAIIVVKRVRPPGLCNLQLNVAFSSKTDYGLVALIELGSAYPSGGVMQVAEIAARQSIPDRYL